MAMSVFTVVRDSVVRILSRSRVVPARVRQLFRGDVRPKRLPVDVYATVDEIVVLASVAGLRPGDIEISFADDLLTMEGKFAPSVANVTYVMRERESGHFSRELALNVPVDAHRASATLKDGVLTLVLPKVRSSQSKVVRVQIEA